MKKLLALLLVCVLSLGLFACGQGNGDSTGGGSSDGPTVEDGVYWVDENDGTYSYNMGPSDLPTEWNVQTYQANQATYILDYSSDALYTFDYNETFDGYKIIPSMAAGDPVDVTDQYIGKYGVKEGDEDKVYEIPLKEGLKYDNGDPLTAKSFEESMKLLLNPDAANFRADNVYQSGSMKIHNAKDYVLQGQTVVTDVGASGDYAGLEDLTKNAEGLYVNESGDVIQIAIDKPLDWIGGATLKLYVDNYGDAYFDAAAFAQLAAMDTDADGQVALSDESMALLTATISNPAWGEGPGYEPNYWMYTHSYGEMEYEGNVGFFAKDDTHLVVVLKNPMEDNFYLRKEFCTSFFLVHPETYKECIADGDVYSCSYGTSTDTYVGFGPYKLTTYVADSQIVLERNEHWHGYYEAALQGTYQTDRVVFKKVTEDATRLQMFEQGQLDSYGLTAADMETYITSPYIYYNDSESTWFLVMNPDMETLEGLQKSAAPVNAGNSVNKTVLTIEAFRKALSFSLDRQSFNQQLSPTSGIAKSLLSSMIIADPESGLSYRATEEGKDAILAFWGLADQVGEGKEFATKDEAIASITGYDPTGAKDLFKQAYDEAVEKGLLKAEQIASGKWEVQITVGQPAAAGFYVNGYEFLKANWTEAVKGTPFEGHLTFTASEPLGDAFGDALRECRVDMLFGVGYGGDMFDPYAMIECFTGSLQYDPFTDKKEVDLDIEIDGVTLRASLYDWTSVCLMGDEINATVIENGKATDKKQAISAGTSADPSLRLTILAKVEEKIMTLSNVFPLMTDATASLKGMRIVYKTEDYVFGVGRGGIQYYTYTHNDADWAAFVQSQGGEVNYKG